MKILKFGVKSNVFYLAFQENEIVPLKITVEKKGKKVGESILLKKVKTPIHDLVELENHITYIYRMNEKFKNNFKKIHKKTTCVYNEKYFNDYKIS
ncbi:MAG: hypothetical protein ACOCP8_08305 [archaeon]